jgi:hypothetical protein
METFCLYIANDVHDDHWEWHFVWSNLQTEIRGKADQTFFIAIITRASVLVVGQIKFNESHLMSHIKVKRGKMKGFLRCCMKSF